MNADGRRFGSSQASRRLIQSIGHTEQMEEYFIRQMAAADWPDVRRIYQEGIDTGNATFETRAPEWDAWDAGHLAHSRLIAERAGKIAGWAALSPVSRRDVYRGVAEVSVYIAPSERGRGTGHRLLAALIIVSEDNGIWTLQASIFPENEASLRLHAAHGFRQVGRRERIAQREGRWRDTILVERRSSAAGLYLN
jgi:L-amino acid N-acyltransferase YncA